MSRSPEVPEYAGVHSAEMERLRATTGKIFSYIESKLPSMNPQQIDLAKRFIEAVRSIHPADFGGEYGMVDRHLQYPFGDTLTLSHEVVHAVGNMHAPTRSEFDSRTDPKNLESKRVVLRNGLASFHHLRSKFPERIFFGALLEAIVDSISTDAGYVDEYDNPYVRERALFAIIREKVVKKTPSMSADQVDGMFIYAHIFGWTRELKQTLLNSFDPNALRILAVLQTEDYQNLLKKGGSNTRDKTLYGLPFDWFRDYFSTEVPEKRTDAAKKILMNTGIEPLLPQTDGVWRTERAQLARKKK